jgi:hypothetical protein
MMSRLLIITLMATVCFSGCKHRTSSRVSSMLNESFIKKWRQQNKRYADSCAYDINGAPYMVLFHDRDSQLRLNLVKQLLQEKGAEFEAHRITISEYSTVHKEYYLASVWFDDEDVGLLYKFNEGTGKFEKRKGHPKRDDQFFLAVEPEWGCCQKFELSTVYGCSYLNVFEARDDETFELVDFCLWYYVP